MSYSCMVYIQARLYRVFFYIFYHFSVRAKWENLLSLGRLLRRQPWILILEFKIIKSKPINNSGNWIDFITPAVFFYPYTKTVCTNCLRTGILLEVIETMIETWKWRVVIIIGRKWSTQGVYSVVNLHTTYYFGVCVCQRMRVCVCVCVCVWLVD